MKIKWGQGFFRVWILLSVALQVFTILFVLSQIESVKADALKTLVACSRLKTIIGNNFDRLDSNTKDKLPAAQAKDGRLSEQDLELFALYELATEEGGIDIRSLCENLPANTRAAFLKIIRILF